MRGQPPMAVARRSPGPTVSSVESAVLRRHSFPQFEKLAEPNRKNSKKRFPLRSTGNFCEAVPRHTISAKMGLFKKTPVGFAAVFDLQRMVGCFLATSIRIHTPMPDAEFDTEWLVDRARAGDLTSVAMLMQRHRQRLKKMIDARMDPRLRARVDPSDVIQDALTTAARRLSEYLETEPIPFYPWLRRITWQTLVHAHQMHLDAAKRSVRRESQGVWGLSDRSTSQLLDVLDGLPGNTSTPSAAADREESRRRVKEALASLAEIDREVLVQRYVEQMSLKEIGAGLDMSEAAAQMRHMRALQKMHKLLKGGAP